MTDTAALPSSWQVLLDLYGFVLPFMLYAAWSTLVFWDLGRREDLSAGATSGWLAVVLLLPFVGALAYLLAARTALPRHFRVSVVSAGVGMYLLVLLLTGGLG
ncbi:MAG: PLDc N-terminal domain-containing protein [Gemmatimonadales bacterium]